MGRFSFTKMLASAGADPASMEFKDESGEFVVFDEADIPGNDESESETSDQPSPKSKETKPRRKKSRGGIRRAKRGSSTGSGATELANLTELESFAKAIKKADRQAVQKARKKTKTKK
jgi:hypothetical protein